MNCPNCASGQTQLFSAIFEGGTSVVESNGSGVGLALTAGGIAPVIGGGASNGIQQTVLAAKASPPGRESVVSSVLCAIFLSPVLAVIATLAVIAILAFCDVATSGFWGDLPGYVFNVSWFCLSALMIVSAVADFRFNRDEWPALHEAWSRQWYCHKCASEFTDIQFRSAA